MGGFGVRGMPTAFLVVDGKGKRRLVGINKIKTDAFKGATLKALNERPRQP